jgi:outer membrane protein
VQEGDTTTTASPSCSFTPNPALPLGTRVDSLEKALECKLNEDPFGALSSLFKNLPFGRENQYNLGLSFSQSVFTGGRVAAQNRVANATRQTAEIAFASSRAQMVLDVTEAYYNAALADRLVTIAEATLTQAETTLKQTKLARDVGNQPEFDLLRAQVTRDNQRPVVIQRRSDRDLAYMRLKQLLELPAEQPLAVSTPLGDSVPATQALLAANKVAASSDTSVDARAAVRQAAQALRTQDALVDVAQSQRLPSVSVVSQYGRVGYPQSGLPAWSDFRSNWTLGVQLQMPLFTGGRIRGDEMVAQANLSEARARLTQTRELAALDARSAIERLNAAEAAWQASAGTVDQAARAYAIAEIRYNEGISTQVELADSRILLQQAEANRALAARDLQVARMRLALLADLPLSGSGSFTAGATQGSTQQATPQQAPPRSGASQASLTGGN